MESAGRKMTTLSIFNFSEICKKSVVLVFEKDISCYIAQNLSLTKLLQLHVEIASIVRNRLQ